MTPCTLRHLSRHAMRRHQTFLYGILFSVFLCLVSSNTAFAIPLDSNAPSSSPLLVFGFADSSSLEVHACSAYCWRNQTLPSATCSTLKEDGATFCVEQQFIDLRGRQRMRRVVDVRRVFLFLGLKDSTAIVSATLASTTIISATLASTTMVSATLASTPWTSTEQLNNTLPWLKGAHTIRLDRVLLRDIQSTRTTLSPLHMFLMHNSTHGTPVPKNWNPDWNLNWCFFLNRPTQDNCLLDLLFSSVLEPDHLTQIPLAQPFVDASVPDKTVNLSTTLNSTRQEIHLATVALLASEAHPELRDYGQRFLAFFNIWLWSIADSFWRCTPDPQTHIVLHVLGNNDAIRQKTTEAVDNLGLANLSLDYISVNMSELSAKLGYWDQIELVRYQYNSANLIRLVLSDYLPPLQTVISMDLDTIISGSVCEMWNQAVALTTAHPLHEFFVAPEPGDFAGYWDTVLTLSNSLGLVYGVNTGIMVWNLQVLSSQKGAWRQHWMSRVVEGLASMVDSPSRLTAMQWVFSMSEQNILNLMLRNMIRPLGLQEKHKQLASWLLPPNWNVPMGTVCLFLVYVFVYFHY